MENFNWRRWAIYGVIALVAVVVLAMCNKSEAHPTVLDDVGLGQCVEWSGQEEMNDYLGEVIESYRPMAVFESSVFTDPTTSDPILIFVVVSTIDGETYLLGFEQDWTRMCVLDHTAAPGEEI